MILFTGHSSGKEPACQAGDVKDAGSIPGWRGSPGGGHGNPLQYSCLQNPMDRGAWRATVHRVAKSQILLPVHTPSYFTLLLIPVIQQSGLVILHIYT